MPRAQSKLGGIQAPALCEDVAAETKKGNIPARIFAARFAAAAAEFNGLVASALRAIFSRSPIVDVAREKVSSFSFLWVH